MDVNGLIDLYKLVAEPVIGVGLVCAGLGVIKKVVSNHERSKEAIITYIIALVGYLLIWLLT